MFRILVLVGALAAGGVAAWLSFGLQQPETAPVATTAAPPEPQVETQEVLVAAADLEPGTALAGEHLRWQELPETAVSPGFIVRSDRPKAIEEFIDQTVGEALFAGDPIRDSKMAKGAGYLSTVLESGMRAVAVRVSAESSAGGFILPNDHVDVLHTGGNGGGRSYTILTNIKVLAIDQSTGNSEGGNTAMGKTATLALNPAQAEVISGAQTTGALSLALRAKADNEEQGVVFTPRGPGITVRIVRSGQSETVQTDGPAR
ncbi:MAG: Flp pilus assembly protein CpaB [Hyphomicrobiales bacterium]